jgi:hypothetical protein
MNLITELGKEGCCLLSTQISYQSMAAEQN